MTRLVITAMVLVASCTPTALAHTDNFPYEATVAKNNVYVRSGSGRKYYHTNKLDRGQKVIVHRHDPGGWYMISPPRGAFSWIRADYIKPTGKNRGVVTENDVVVWVGSTFGSDHDVIQRKLSINDSVEILGEQTFRTRDRTVRMFKIAPPTFEYRWILGKYVLPTDAIARRKRDRNPFAVPSNAKLVSESSKDEWSSPQQQDFSANDLADRMNKHHNNTAVHQRGPSTEVLAEERNQLRRLDDQFRDIISYETSAWYFAQLEQDYLELQQAVERIPLKKQIGLRLDAVERYQNIKAEYDDFIQLTSATDRREKSLLAIQQNRSQNPTAGPTLAEPEKPFGQPVSSEFNSDSDSVATMPTITVPSRNSGQAWNSPSQPELGSPTLSFEPVTSTSQKDVPDPIQVPQQQEQPQQPKRTKAQQVPKFDGAGIVQRAAAGYSGVPRHVLLTPNGRILAYLQGDSGVDLDRHLGRSFGITGKRWHRADLKTDFIVVRQLTPVRLIP